MKKLGFFFALIAVLALATGAFADSWDVKLFGVGGDDTDSMISPDIERTGKMGVYSGSTSSTGEYYYALYKEIWVVSSDTGEVYDYGTSSADVVDGDFVITGDGTSDWYVATYDGVTRLIAPKGEYGTATVAFAKIVSDDISDDIGCYSTDIDVPKFKYTVKYENPTTVSSGCNAAYAPFALLLAAPLFFFRKKD